MPCPRRAGWLPATPCAHSSSPSLLALAFAGARAVAQDTAPPTAPDAGEAEGAGPDATQPGAPQGHPYDKRLMRLSEVLGSLHFLRPLCGGEDGTRWRDAMAAVLEAEKPDDERRALMVARFNRGYSTFRRSYTVCTPSAVRAANRYRLEGVRLTAQIVSRYAR